MLKQLTSKKPEKAFNVLSLDSEDSDGKTYIWCVWGHYNGREIDRNFTDRKDVVKFLFHRRWTHTILTGVNLDYDLNTLKYKGGFNWDCKYNMGKLMFATPSEDEKEKHSLGHQAIQIIEIGNWILNTSLKQMCDDFKIEGHIDKHVLGRDGNESEMIEACTSHAKTAVLVFELLQTQIHRAGGRMTVTSSSSALDCFRRHHLDAEKQIYDMVGSYPSGFGLSRDETDEIIIENARLAAIAHEKMNAGLASVGGRCESYNSGLYNNISSIDINSSYPHQMRNKRAYPDINTYSKGNYTPEDLIYLFDDFEGCAHVKVYSPPRRIPFLHYKTGDKLLFPTGVFTGWYTFIELKVAVDNGYKILDCYEVSLYKRTEGMFDSYIDRMYALKENKQTKKAGKLYMNGLSGKFGQKVPDDSGFQIVDELPDGAEIDGKTYFLFGGMLYTYIPRPKDAVVEYKSTAYPILYAYITAYGRIQLWETIQAIGEGHIKYVDTDSIHADADKIKEAVNRGDIDIHDTKLGAWGYDYEDGTLEVRGLKYYRYHEAGSPWVYKMKGVPSRMHAEYWLNRCIWVDRVRKIKTALRRGTVVNEFVRMFRRDRKESPKRAFSRRDSKPPKITE